MPKKFDDCVRQVSKRKGIRDPYAICNASLSRTRRMNPNNRDVKKALKLYQEFRESPPKRGREIELDLPKVLMVMGHCYAIDYDTTRGRKTEHYRHEFAPGSRPLICAGGDPPQLFLIGGRYHVTERGITDIDPTGKELD